MALTHTTTIRNGLADLVVDAIDAGTTDAAGSVLIATTGFASTLVNIPLAAPPAFGAAASGVATASGLPKEATATATGTAAVFRIEDRDNTEIFQGVVTATGGGGDMELSSLSVTSGDTVRINTFTYTASA